MILELKEFVARPGQKHIRVWNSDYSASLDAVVDDWHHGTFTLSRWEPAAVYLWDHLLMNFDVGALTTVEQPRQTYLLTLIELLHHQDRIRVVTERAW